MTDFKKIRFWLAGKIIGGNITTEPVEVTVQKAVEDAHHEWIKRQLALGNSITLEYKVTAIEEEKRKRGMIKKICAANGHHEAEMKQ